MKAKETNTAVLNKESFQTYLSSPNEGVLCRHILVPIPVG